MTIVVAGYTGLVGSAIYELLQVKGESVIGLNRSVVDLLDRRKTFEFLNDVKPAAVIDSAAVVGGIGANNTYPVDFLSQNLQIQTNLILRTLKDLYFSALAAFIRGNAHNR